jgi:hypothetical protein
MHTLIDSLQTTFGIQANAMRHNGKVVMHEGKFQPVRNMTVPKSRVSW